jgi:hypothetical protein
VEGYAGHERLKVGDIARRGVGGGVSDLVRGEHGIKNQQGDRHLASSSTRSRDRM